MRFIPLLALALAVGAVNAQAPYPDKPIKVIVPFSAGGSADVVPRVVGQKLSERWGQPLVVDNRPGAGGNIGAQAVATAAADGYTLLATPAAPLVANRYLYKSLPFAEDSLTPITVIATAPVVLAVRKEFPAANVREFAEYARSHPEKISVATQGTGTTGHLAGLQFEAAGKSRLLFVPYKGTAPALSDLMGGQVDAFFDVLTSARPAHDSGKVRIIAVTGQQRSPLLPNVPTFAEQGMPEMTISTWFALAAPKGTPKPIIERIQADVAEVLKREDVRKELFAISAAPVGSTPADAAAFIQQERARWKGFIEAADIPKN